MGGVVDCCVYELGEDVRYDRVLLSALWSVFLID